MICKLCHLKKSLRNSHIIPEFQYKPLYDEKHRFKLISIDPEKRERYIQKGVREKLLCANCEAKFSRWESYAHKVIFKKETHLIYRRDSFVRLGGVSYCSFKLYLLSLLWRMGVSELDFFTLVSLGPHEEKLRVRLLNEDPGDPSEYPCFIKAVLVNGRFQTDWITQPDFIKVDGVRCYRTVISGVLYVFFVTEKPLPIDARQFAINRQGNFLMKIERLEEIDFLREQVLRHSKKMNENEI